MLPLLQSSPPPQDPVAPSLLPQQSKDRLPLVLGGSLILSLINTLLLGILSIVLLRLTNNRPVLVQTLNGQVIEAQQSDYQHRTPQTIQKFIEMELGLLFTWDGLLPSEPGTSPTEDPGVSIKIGRSTSRIPSGSHLAQFGLSNDGNFRAGFMESLGKMVPREIFGGGITQAYEIGSLSAPIAIGPGKWKLDVVSSRVLISRSGKHEVIPFNREIFVQTVHIQDPLPGDGPYTEMMKQIRTSGLEIYAMRERKIHDIK